MTRVGQADLHIFDGESWKPAQMLDSDIRVLARDYLYGIAEGDVPNHTAFSKLGYSAGGTTSETDVWGAATAYTFPTGSMQMECYSSSVQDNPAGSGAKTVRIYYLKSDYTEATTDVLLSGTASIPTSVSDIYRVNNFRVLDWGTNNTAYKAAGNIDVRNLADTPIYSRILLGQTRARNSVYTVPHGKTLYVTSMAVGTTKASTVGNNAIFTLRATYDDKLGTLLTPGFFFMPYAEMNHADGQVTRDFKIPLRFISHTDLKVSVTCGQSSTICTSSLRGWLE